METEDRFTLEGFTYYRQGRKCGRPGCKCAKGELHGPYWYKRNLESGKVSYLGRDLPQEIAAARGWHDLLAGDMRRARLALAEAFDAVGRLLRGEALSAGDRCIIEALGLGAALVSQRDNQVTQDDPEGALVLAPGEASAQDSGALVSTGGRFSTQDDPRALAAVFGRSDPREAASTARLYAAILGATQDAQGGGYLSERGLNYAL